MAGLCESRVVYRSEANGDPSQIDAEWLATQVCTTVPLDQQFCWFDPETNKLYFVFRGGINQPVLGVTPSFDRFILVDDLLASLVDASDNFLVEDQITE